MATSEAQKDAIYKLRERDRWRRKVSQAIAAQSMAATAQEARENGR